MGCRLQIGSSKRQGGESRAEALIHNVGRPFVDSAARSAKDTTPYPAQDQPYYHALIEDGTHAYVAQSNIDVARVPAGSSNRQALQLFDAYSPLFSLRAVAWCFQTIEVTPWEKKGGSSARGKCAKEDGGKVSGSSSGGQIKMVMGPWLRRAWPFG